MSRRGVRLRGRKKRRIDDAPRDRKLKPNLAGFDIEAAMLPERCDCAEETKID
jgi:hypothetical protein